MYSREVSAKVSERWRATAFYTCVSASALIVLIFAMDLRSANIHIPFAYAAGDTRFPEYGFDVTLYLVTIKGMIDNGWILTNRWLAAPGVARFHDFPQFQFDSLQFATMKLLSFFFNDAAATLNSYYVLTFPATAGISAWVMRRLRFSLPAAFTFSLLYAFSPYHFHKGVYHLGYSAYYLVPLVTLVCVWIIRRELTPGEGASSASPPLLLACFFAALIAVWNLYYTFFALFLLFLSTLIAYMNAPRQERERVLKTSVILFAVGAVIALLNLSSVITHVLTNGRNPSPVHREAFQSEWWGLRIAQLLLPSRDHRWEWMRVPALNLRINWERALGGSGKPTPINTNEAITLGVIGAFGFVVLLLTLLRRRDGSWSINDELSRLNLGLVLLTTIGGFGMLLSVLTEAYIRSYYRGAVFIAYWSLLAVAALVDRYAGGRRRVHVTICAALLAFGLFDQVGTNARPLYSNVQRAFDADRHFFGHVESMLPPGSMVFQLPAQTFPEEGVAYAARPYDDFVPYLHTSRIRWSFGAMNGRSVSRWQQETAALPAPVMTQRLRRSGFAGILLDRYAFIDRGERLLVELRREAAQETESADSRYVFLRLR